MTEKTLSNQLKHLVRKNKESVFPDKEMLKRKWDLKKERDKLKQDRRK